MNRYLPPTAAVLVLVVVLSAGAQVPRGEMQIGPVHVTFGDNNKFVGDTLHLNDVVLTSKEYDLQAATVVADMLPTAGVSRGKTSFSKIVANGDPTKKTQVTGHFASVEQARTYLVRGDKAVFVPEPARPGGGRIDFTGHVVVTLQSPQALDGPAVTHLEHATVLVGAQPDYPQVEFGAGSLDFTPLQ